MNQSFARMERQWKSVSRAASNARKKYLNLNTAIGALAGSTGLGLLVKRSIDAADAIAKTADAIGISTDALQEYRYIAERSGVATTQLDRGLGAFTKRLGEMRQGTGELNSKIEDFNTELRDQLVAAKDTSEALGIFFDALQDVENQSERVALMSAAMSRTAGVAMTNMIDNVDELRERFNDLGISIEEDLLRHSEQAKDSIDDLGAVISTSFTRAVVALAPEIGQTADNMADWVGENKEFLTQDVPRHIKNITEEIGAFATAVSKIPDPILYGGLGFIYGGKFGAAGGFGYGLGKELSGLLSDAEDYQDILNAINVELEKLEQRRELAQRALKIEQQMVVPDKKIIKNLKDKIALLDKEIARYESIKKKYEEVGRAAEESGEKGKEAGEKGAEGAKQHRESVDRTTDAYKVLIDQAEKWDRQISRSMIQGPGLGAMTGADDSWGRSEWASKAEEYDEAIQKMRDSIAKLRMDEIEYIEYTRKKALAAAEDKWSGEKLKRYEKLINELYDLEIKEAERATSEIDELWKNMVGNIQDYFADGIENMLDGEINSFEDFFSQILDSFKRMIAEMAAYDLTKKIFGTAGQGIGLFTGGEQGGGILGQVGNISKIGSGISNLFGGGGGTLAAMQSVPAVGAPVAAAAPMAIEAGTGALAGSTAAAGAGAAGIGAAAPMAIEAGTGALAGSTAAAGAGAAGIGAALSAALPIAGIVLGALALGSGLFSSDPEDARFQMAFGKQLSPDRGYSYGFGQSLTEGGDYLGPWKQREVNKAVGQHFQQQFRALDEAFGVAVRDIVKQDPTVLKMDDFQEKLEKGGLPAVIEVLNKRFLDKYSDEILKAVKAEVPEEALKGVELKGGYKRQIATLTEAMEEYEKKIRDVNDAMSEISKMTQSIIGPLDSIRDKYREQIETLKDLEAASWKVELAQNRMKDALDFTRISNRISDLSNDLSDMISRASDLIQNKIQAIGSIDEMLYNLRGGSNLAPVQSMEFFQLRYQDLLSEAQGGTSQELQSFLRYLESYTSNMNTIMGGGQSYKELVGSITGDLESLRSDISGGKTLDDLHNELVNIDENTAQTALNTSIQKLAGQIGGVQEELEQAREREEEIQEREQKRQKYLSNVSEWRNKLENRESTLDDIIDRIDRIKGNDNWSGSTKTKWIDRRTEQRNRIAEAESELEKWENKLSNLQTGGNFSGMALVGEQGPEIIRGSGTVYSNADSQDMLTNAVKAGVQQAIGGNITASKQSEIHVHLDVDGKEFAHIVAEEARSGNIELIESLREVVNG